MRFYIVTVVGEVVGAHQTLRAAHEEGKFLDEDYSITAVDVEVTAETVRRLLGDLGGYAKSSQQVWPKVAA